MEAVCIWSSSSLVSVLAHEVGAVARRPFWVHTSWLVALLLLEMVSELRPAVAVSVHVLRIALESGLWIWSRRATSFYFILCGIFFFSCIFLLLLWFFNSKTFFFLLPYLQVALVAYHLRYQERWQDLFL